jgi:hypothetical protein
MTHNGYSRSGGGPLPTGNGTQPVHSCPCGAMYTGGRHTCRQTSRQAEAEPEAG